MNKYKNLSVVIFISIFFNTQLFANIFEIPQNKNIEYQGNQKIVSSNVKQKPNIIQTTITTKEEIIDEFSDGKKVIINNIYSDKKEIISNDSGEKEKIINEDFYDVSESVSFESM
jgi:hypothetical protein